MVEGSGKAREISLGDDFDVVVKVNGIRIDVHTDGSVDACLSHVVFRHLPSPSRIGDPIGHRSMRFSVSSRMTCS